MRSSYKIVDLTQKLIAACRGDGIVIRLYRRRKFGTYNGLIVTPLLFVRLDRRKIAVYILGAVAYRLDLDRLIVFKLYATSGRVFFRAAVYYI